jgi:hypothetical protein
MKYKEKFRYAVSLFLFLATVNIQWMSVKSYMMSLINPCHNLDVEHLNIYLICKYLAKFKKIYFLALCNAQKYICARSLMEIFMGSIQ